MAFQFTIQDNTNGTATLTVSGSAGANWLLHGCPVGEGFASSGYSMESAGTGDDTRVITPSFGAVAANWILLSGGNIIGSQFLRVTVDAPDLAPHHAAAQHIVDGLKIIGVAGYATADIKIRRIPKLLNQELDRPTILVSPFPAEREVYKLNNRDDVVYPVTVVMYRPLTENDSLDAGMKTDFKERQRIAKAFRNHRPQPLPGAMPLIITWRPDLPTSPVLLVESRAVGIMIFECGYRETKLNIV